MKAIFLIAWYISCPLWVHGETVGHVTRDYFGDIFSLEDCQPGSCEKEGRRAAEIPGEKCRCQCAPSHYTFREDMRQCIKDVGGNIYLSYKSVNIIYVIYHWHAKSSK